MLRAIQTEMESLKQQLRTNLEKADKQPENMNAGTAQLSIPMTVGGRRKRQALIPTSTTAIEGIEVMREGNSTNADQANASQSVATGGIVDANKDNKKTFDQVVDEIIGVLDVVQKTKEDIKIGVTNDKDIGSQLSTKLHTGMLNIKDLAMATPAEKQLARDLLARIEKDEADISKTIKVMEGGNEDQADQERQSNIVARLTTLYTTVMQVEMMLQNQLNTTATGADISAVNFINTVGNNTAAATPQPGNITVVSPIAQTNTTVQTSPTSENVTELELLLDEVRNITDKIQTMKESLTDDTISVIEKAKGGLGRIVQMHMLGVSDKMSTSRLLKKIQDTKTSISLAVQSLKTK